MIRSPVSLFLLLVSFGVCAQAPDLDEVRRLMRDGRTDDALVAIDARLAADAGDRDARFLKGVALAEKQDTDGAIEVFTALSRDYPELPEPHNNLAVLYATKGDYEKSRDALLQAISTHPSYATAHENLGDIYAKMAGLAYTRALSLETDNATAKDKLALIDNLFSRNTVTAPVATARRAPEPVAEPASPRATMRPSPPPAVAPDDDLGAGRDAIAAVEAWAAAWSEQDVDRYLAAYDPDYAPAGMDRSAWAAQRRERLRKPAFIEIQVDGFQVRRDGESRVDVTFVQSFRSNTYQDRVRKQLSLARGPQGWMITGERTLAKL